MTAVAPLAGSVDRNPLDNTSFLRLDVAPLAGSVDRNNDGVVRIYTLSGRSPRGERG